MLGVEWKQTDLDLTVQMPEAPPCPHAVTLRVQSGAGNTWDAE